MIIYFSSKTQIPSAIMKQIADNLQRRESLKMPAVLIKIVKIIKSKEQLRNFYSCTEAEM
jgi:hypothetical protein